MVKVTTAVVLSLCCVVVLLRFVSMCCAVLLLLCQCVFEFLFCVVELCLFIYCVTYNLSRQGMSQCILNPTFSFVHATFVLDVSESRYAERFFRVINFPMDD